MLKRVRFKNFVHFHEEQDLQLVEGPNICVGQNGSGKSAMFEAVRSCMSTSKNIGSPSSHDKSKPSVVICYFYLNGMQNARGDILDDQMLSCVIRLPDKGVRIKLVFLKNKHELHIDLLRLNKEKYNVNVPLSLSLNVKDKVMRVLLLEKFDLDEFVNELRDIDFVNGELDVTNSDVKYNSTTPCEIELLKHVDPVCVIYFPTRSTAPVQWTISERLHPDAAENILEDVQKRSEVLNWYLDKGFEIPGFQHNVDTYFEMITDNLNVRFKKDKERGIVAFVDESTVEDISLENVSEGIYEAMNCAILLACPKFKTVCFDEIGRGMHPQMVERLRDLILRKIRDKFILVTTHKTAFVTAWILPRMMFFKAGPSADSETKIIPGSRFYQNGNSEKVSRLITSRYFSSVFFARRLLLVEGEGDLLFMTAMKNNILDGKHNSLLQTVFETLKRSFEHISGKKPDELIEMFYRFLWPLHILGLNGEANKVKLHNVCEILEIERYFILDFEAITDDFNPYYKDNVSYRQFIQDFGLLENTAIMDGLKPDEIHEKIKENVGVLEKAGIFIWKNYSVESSNAHRGSIESAVRELHVKKPDSTLKRRLEDNCVTLQWDPVKKVKHRHKLFVHKRLTDSNIDNVVNDVLETCHHATDSEFFRLITFLCKSFLKGARIT